MTHKLYDYEYEYFRNVLEYTSTEYFRPMSGANYVVHVIESNYLRSVKGPS